MLFNSLDHNSSFMLIGLNTFFLLILLSQSKFFYKGLISSFTALVRENLTFNESLSNFSLFISVNFSLILVLNLFSLFPSSYSVSTLFPFIILLSLHYWLPLLLSSMSHNFVFSMSMFCPSSMGVGASFFLSLIEPLSFFIRPLTLSLRLSINMSAGHILLSLLASSVTSSLLQCVLMGGLTLLLVSGYIFFEVGMSLIQSSVFNLLLTSYQNDHSQ